MKTLLVRFALPALAAVMVSSCAAPPQATGPAPGMNTVYQSYGTGFVTYSTLPSNYSGAAYYHGGRYYAGGRHESGKFTHQGRTYSSRYYHNGRYYYGGAEQQYPGGRQGTQRRNFASRNVQIGSTVNDSPITNTTSNRNADVYDTSATRGPSLSFHSPWTTRRTYDNANAPR